MRIAAMKDLQSMPRHHRVGFFCMASIFLSGQIADLLLTGYGWQALQLLNLLLSVQITIGLWTWYEINRASNLLKRIRS